MRLKKRHTLRKGNVLVFIVIFLFVFICWFLSYVNRRVSPTLFNFAEIETTKLANLIINRAINRQVAKALDLDDLFVLIKNNDGEIETIDFNTAIVNKILSTTTNSIQIYLKAIEQGNIDLIELPEEILIEYDREKLKKGIIYEVPLGIATKNIFLANLGPKIPIRMGLVGSVVSNINTKLNQYGINNVLVEVNIVIEVVQQVNLPFMSKRVNLKTNVPLALKVIQGKIPQYYQGGGFEKNSSLLALPIE